jgi:adenine-specific DNA methylase
MDQNRYKKNGKAEKILGAVYTPPRIASALVRWAVRSQHDRVCDPACGEGVFLAAARTRLADLGNSHPTCIGVDIDPLAAERSGGVRADFFEWFENAPKFDVMVGNPPFIRSHLFSDKSRDLAFWHLRTMGLNPSRLMSTWAPFLALSSQLLTETGRLAFVIPEELLHINYAEELRRHLLEIFRRVIVCLPGHELFSSVQQSVVLLLCEKDRSGPEGLFRISFSDLEDGELERLEPAPVWSWTSKWTHLFLDDKEQRFLDGLFSRLNWKAIKDHGRVEVGVVTGDNSFFLLKKGLAEDIGQEYLQPIITSARDLSGLNFSAQDFGRLARDGRPLYVLTTDDPIKDLPPQLKNYLKRGMETGVNDRYKCRIREPWYAVPGIWPAQALLLRQAGEMPRLIHLAKRLASTDTIHRVRWNDPALGKRYVTGFLNTSTLIFCEIMGRSYGGGVLELMPGEANKIPIPEPVEKLEAIFDEVDALIREKDYYRGLDVVDKVVKPKWMNKQDSDDARTILCKLIERRKHKQNGIH